MLVIAILGIRLTARTQVGMGLIEYVILVGFAIAGLVLVLSHHHGTFPFTRGWVSVTGIGGKGSLAAGFLIVVFMYTGWDGSIYVNEEAKHRSTNPGRAAILAVVFLAIIYTMSEVGLQGVVSPARLQANSDSALVYVARAIGGGGWEKVMALALALSVIASTGTGIVVISRMVYRMASRRVLPEVLSRISPRFSTPAVASIVISLIVIAIMWVYLLSSSVANVFTDLIDVTGLLYIGVLHPHRGRGHGLLPQPRVQQRLGRADRRDPAHPGLRVPGLDPGQVALGRARVAALVDSRDHRRWPGPDVLRPLPHAVAVLPGPAGKRYSRPCQVVTHASLPSGSARTQKAGASAS